jgi:hypothetical protein
MFNILIVKDYFLFFQRKLFGFDFYKYLYICAKLSKST